MMFFLILDVFNNPILYHNKNMSTHTKFSRLFIHVLDAVFIFLI
jgi:hypothetical protein